MASVLRLSQPQSTSHNQLFSDMEPLSLNLELSLGGPFSKQRKENFQGFREILKVSQSSSSFPVEEMKACITPPARPTNSLWDVPCSFDGSPLTVAYMQETRLNHFETKSLQAQRRHEARKRRKSIMEGKLHKRAKGDSQEDLTRLSNAQYLEFPTPCWDDQAKECFFIEEAGKNGMDFEEFVCKHGVPAIAHSNSILPAWVKNDALNGSGSMLGSGIAGVSTGHTHINMQPAAMLDFMNVLSSEKDVQMGMRRAVSSEVKQEVNVGRDATSAPPSAFSLQNVVPLQSVIKQGKSFDAQHALNYLGDVVSSVQHSSSLSSTSSGFSHLTSCVPFEHHAVLEPPHYAEVATPTSGSSSQLLSWNTGRKFDDEGRHLSDGDNGDKSCNSSSSEIGDVCARDEQSRFKEEQAEQGQPTVTMPAIYPHPFPMMPLPYPYGVPLPWSLSFPWVMQGSSDQKAFGMPFSLSPSVEQSKEAFANPFGRFPSTYNLPVLGSNYTSPWLPFVPTGAVACKAVENPIGKLDKTLHPDQIEGQENSDFGQDLRGEADLDALDMQVKSTVEGDKEDKDIFENLKGETVKARQYCVAADEPMQENLKEHGLSMGDCKSSQSGKQTEKGDTEFQKHVAVGRQQSFPLASKKVAKKKKKVVRFNSIDGAGTRMCNEVVHSVNGTESISSQQCVSAVDCSTQTCVVPSNTDLSVDPQGSCRDGSQNLKLVEGHVNLRTVNKPCADNAILTDNLSVGGGDMDLENVEEGSSALSPSDKSATKESLVGSHSVTTLLRVITHGSGPLGKTIHGVMYITKEKQARLICVCHGKHMSPLEFVEHSGSTNLSNPERSIVLEPFSCVDHDISVLA